jgi:hypothetical protein
VITPALQDTCGVEKKPIQAAKGVDIPQRAMPCPGNCVMEFGQLRPEGTKHESLLGSAVDVCAKEERAVVRAH